jgi:hypothetical protein
LVKNDEKKKKKKKERTLDTLAAAGAVGKRTATMMVSAPESAATVLQIRWIRMPDFFSYLPARIGA